MKTEFSIKAIDSLNNSTVLILLEPLTEFKYKVGQYIYLPMKTKKTPFSIVNTPNDGKWIEVHIGELTGDSLIDFELEALKLKFRLGETIFIDKAKGNTWLRDSSSPLVLVAWEAGYSYTRGMLYHELNKKSSRNISLYWGGKTKNDLYEYNDLVRLYQTHHNFNFIAVAENPHISDFLRKGNLLDVFFDNCDLSENRSEEHTSELQSQ